MKSCVEFATSTFGYEPASFKPQDHQLRDDGAHRRLGDDGIEDLAEILAMDKRGPLLPPEALKLSRSCWRPRCGACRNLDSSRFGYSADRPSPAREDNRRNDHGERDEDPRLADPQRCSSARARRIERGLDYRVPARVQRDRRPHAPRLQPQTRVHEANRRVRDHEEQSREGRRRANQVEASQDDRYVPQAPDQAAYQDRLGHPRGDEAREHVPAPADLFAGDRAGAVDRQDGGSHNEVEHEHHNRSGVLPNVWGDQLQGLGTEPDQAARPRDAVSDQPDNNWEDHRQPDRLPTPASP